MTRTFLAKFPLYILYFRLAELRILPSGESGRRVCFRHHHAGYRGGGGHISPGSKGNLDVCPSGACKCVLALSRHLSISWLHSFFRHLDSALSADLILDPLHFRSPLTLELFFMQCSIVCPRVREFELICEDSVIQQLVVDPVGSQCVATI